MSAIPLITNYLLNNPGQANTRISVKSSGSSQDITIKALEDAQLETSINIAKERHRIYPLRKSSEEIRALRGARDFRLLSDYYSMANGTYKNDKLITYTEAYLYVTDISKDETKEYKVVNRGDLFNPQMYYVQFKDTQTKVLRRYIPFYEESGDLEFVYSNVKLTDKDRAKFTTTRITIESKKNSCIFHHKEYSKNIKLSEKIFKKHIYSAKDIKENSKSRKYLSTIIFLDDPVGEVEDLYNEYEFSYHRHYGMNKSIIDAIKEKNQYAYTIAEILDYLYVNTSEQKLYDKQRDELREQYILLADELKMFGDYIFEKGTDRIIGTNLASFIDYKVAKDYIDEVKFIDEGFFESISPWFKYYDEKHFYLNTKKNSYLYAKESDRRNYSGGGFSQQYLRIQGNGYKEEESPSDAFAFVLFTICFSKKHKTELDKYPKLQEAANKFYYLLKNATPLPKINEKVKDEIHNKLFNQNEFIKTTTGRDSLLNEYRELDDKLQEIAFDAKIHKKLIATNSYDFKALKTAKEDTTKIFYDENLKTPQKLLKNISKALSSSELKSTLENYKSIEVFESDDDKYAYYLYLINLAFMLIDPRVKIDEETQELSPFTKGNKPIQEFLSFIGKELQTLDEEMALKLHEEDIKLLYLNSLYSLIAEAKLSKGARASNADSFLKNFEIKVNVNKEETSELLSQDFDKELKLKSDSQSMFETLKKIDGVSSYLDKFEESEGEKKGRGTKTSLDSKQATPRYKLLNSKPYKQLLNSTKALSFFIAAGNIAEFMKGKEKLKLNNLVNLSQDILSVSSSLAEFSSKADHKLSQRITQRVSKFSIPSSLDDLAKVNKVASPSSMRVIARFGLVPVMLNATIELSQINKEENLNYFIAVGAKNAIYLAMLFTPATVGVGTIVLSVAMLELSWALVKDTIENSKLELFIEDSLLFEKQDSFMNRSLEDKFKAPMLIKAINSSSKKFFVSGVETKGSEIKGFKSIDKIREFIADNYDAHSSLLDAALINELSQLRAILYGFSMTQINNYKPIDLRYGSIEIHPKSQHSIKLSSSLKSSAEVIYLSYFNVDNESKRVYEKLQINTEYDITGHLLSQDRFSTILDSINFNAKSDIDKISWVGSPSQTQVLGAMLKDVYIIVVTPETTLRYNVVYNHIYRQAQTEIYIEEIQTTQLSEEDMKEIKGTND
ncbi:hypothetical protein [Sulfurimonas sp.]|uniref:hypothetical protein n=1 Tax=Sulfurimonas sp. TaxID=2022749 RepID=UPI003BA8DADA